MTEYFSAGQILAKTFTLLRQGAGRAVVALIPMAALGTLVDAGVVDERNTGGLNLLVSAISIAAAFWITKALLQEVGDPPLHARFPQFFGLGLLTGLGILLGAILIVIPGIILFVRWSVSSPILLANDVGVTEAMQQSWRATGPHFWPILVAFLAFYGPGWGLAVAAYGLETSMPNSIVPAIVANLAINAALIAGWHVAVAIHTFLDKPDSLAETFA